MIFPLIFLLASAANTASSRLSPFSELNAEFGKLTRFLRPDEIPGQIRPASDSPAEPPHPDGGDADADPITVNDSPQTLRVIPFLSLTSPLIAVPSDGSSLTIGFRKEMMDDKEVGPDFGTERTETDKEAEPSEREHERPHPPARGSSSSSKHSSAFASGSSTFIPGTGSCQPSAKCPEFKLIYFDARGICEAIRLMFRYANVSFVDERLSKKQWLRMKDHTFFGKIPILEVDGKKLGQCYAISRYLARKFDLAGDDDWDQAKVDEVAEFHRGVVSDMSAYVYVLGGFKDGNREELRRTVFIPTVDKNFSIYVRLLKDSKSGFFARRVTWIDFAISEFITTLNTYEPQIMRKYPLLLRFVERIQSLPQIRQYIKDRAKTPL